MTSDPRPPADDADVEPTTAVSGPDRQDIDEDYDPEHFEDL